MKYPARFIDDLKYLAAWYEWTQEDKDEIKKMFVGSKETVNFLMALADAHRAGYNNPAGKCFVTLETWCEQNNLHSPFKGNFDISDWKHVDNLNKT